MNLGVENLLSELSWPLWLFLTLILCARFALVHRWQGLTPGAAAEMFVFCLAEIRFMGVWATNQYLFHHIVVLLSGFFICWGLSILLHMWMLRRGGKRHFDRGLTLASLFFPGIYILELLNLVF